MPTLLSMLYRPLLYLTSIFSITGPVYQKAVRFFDIQKVAEPGKYSLG